VRDRQLLALVIEQVHREGVELGDPGDERRQLGKQLVEIEDGRHFPPELEQRDHELADVRRRGGRDTGRRRGRKGLGQGELKLYNQPLMDLTLPLDHAAIERILPHRYPFLLVDRITEMEVDKRIVGIKNVSLNERYLSQEADGRP